MYEILTYKRIKQIKLDTDNKNIAGVIFDDEICWIVSADIWACIINAYFFCIFILRINDWCLVGIKIDINISDGNFIDPTLSILIFWY